MDFYPDFWQKPKLEDIIPYLPKVRDTTIRINTAQMFAAIFEHKLEEYLTYASIYYDQASVSIFYPINKNKTRTSGSYDHVTIYLQSRTPWAQYPNETDPAPFEICFDGKLEGHDFIAYNWYKFHDLSILPEAFDKFKGYVKLIKPPADWQS